MIPAGRRRWVRTGWLALVGVILALHLLGIAVRFQALRQVCVQSEPVCHATAATWQATPADVAALGASGFSLDGYAMLEAGKWVVFSALWLAVGGLIFARQSEEWMALVVAFFLVTFPTQWDGISIALTNTYPRLALPVQLLQYLVSFGLILFTALFPNGRFVPRWSLWIALLYAALNFPFVPAAWQTAQLALSLCGLGGLVLAQVIRYWRYSSAPERERTRWVVFGFCFSIVLFFLMLSTVLFGNIHIGPTEGPLSDYATQIFFQVSVAVIPLSVGVAILRNRLFDIDIIIRRTLVYALLTGLLALAYFGSVVVLQNTFSALTGQAQSTLVTVLSTLVIAALFVPLRARVQSVIDRRLYRRKYDSAKTLALFSATLRDEVDLGQLSEQLVGVVDETMQPASVGLWLRAPERRQV